MVIAFSLLWQFPAQAAESISIPTEVYTNGEQQVLAPDWSQIAWGSLPAIGESGEIQVSSKFLKELGYDPSRVWFSGDRPEQFVMLGDVRDAFHMEAFNLKDISGLSGLAMETLTLNNFGLTQWQTPESLIKAIPKLGSLQVNQVAPIQDLLKITGVESSGSIAQLIEQNPTFARMPLGELDLEQYNLQSIPGLSQTALGKFKGWQQSFIAQVPGLNSIPFNQFPIPLIGGNISVGLTSDIWSRAEHGDPEVPANYFISGTINRKDKTVPVPCEAGKPCAYIELSDPIGANAPLHGKRWVSGKTQQVKGGFGPLKAVNNGWEPTGKLVFGSAFKVVLTDTDESKGIANFALYFRACVRIPFYGKSCTPYFIGGIPWFPTNEKGLVVVASSAKPNVNVGSKYQEQIAQIEQQYEPQPTPEDANVNQSPTANIDPSSKVNTSTNIKPGEANTRIVDAINNLGRFPSNVPGTDGGRNACMWAVNRVLKEAGYATLGNDTLAVRTGQAALENGRGQKLNITDAEPGDIVLVDKGGSSQHIGFCMNKGCTQTISNSSSRASFSFRGNSNFSYSGSPYNGATPQVYRLEK